MNRSIPRGNIDKSTSAMELLKRYSLRRTKPRIAIINLLLNQKHPLSVEEMQKVKELDSIDRVTIYRSLAAFEEVELVRRSFFKDGVSRYQYQTQHCHHHIICNLCNKIENVERCIPKSMTNAIHMMGYADVTHSLEFFGVCRKCYSNTKN